MSPQKDGMITRQVLEQLTKGKVSPWTLGSPTTTLRMGSLSISIITNTDTWLKNAN